ncbi:MAG TPA: cysteine desulfurase family protein [Nevskiaceae bacterium]|nr:cysteine desulfurase family protein [Nevskiaceae bacterium]
MKKVYLDNAATTPVDPEVFKAMKPYYSLKFGNASEPHFWGQEARKAIDQARDQVARFLGCKSGEIIFTSCATESINLAHKGLVEALSRPKAHIIISSVEHKAVLETCKHLEKLGMAKVTYLPVDKYGLVKVADVEKVIKPETVLVSVMYANNEVGTIEPIEEIGGLIKKINKTRRQKVFFHTDATQGIQYLDCYVDKLGVDLLSFSGHKIYAPKGIGVLYLRKGTPLIRQQDGGWQEYRLRAGTENVPYIVGLGKAIELVVKNQKLVVKRLSDLRDKLVKEVLQIPGTKLTGHPTQKAPHIASFVVKGVEGEAVLLHLSDKGIAASSGSACTSGLLKPSHVLTAMGIPVHLSHGSLRFSLGKSTTEQKIDYAVKVLPAIIKKLRKMAPKGI